MSDHQTSEKNGFFLLSNPNLPCLILGLISQVLTAGRLGRPDSSWRERWGFPLLQAKLPQVPQPLLINVWGKGDFWGC